MCVEERERERGRERERERETGELYAFTALRLLVSSVFMELMSHRYHCFVSKLIGRLKPIVMCLCVCLCTGRLLGSPMSNVGHAARKSKEFKMKSG